MHYAAPPTRRHLNAPEGNRSAVSPRPAGGRSCRVACQCALNNALACAEACGWAKTARWSREMRPRFRSRPDCVSSLSLNAIAASDRTIITSHEASHLGRLKFRLYRPTRRSAARFASWRSDRSRDYSSKTDSSVALIIIPSRCLSRRIVIALYVFF